MKFQDLNKCVKQTALSFPVTAQIERDENIQTHYMELANEI